MPERVLILGSGFVGREFARSCDQRGLVHRLAGRSECDLLDPVAVSRLVEEFRPDSVVMTAAVVRLKANDLNALGQNVAMAENVALATESVPHVVFLSSIDVYGRENLGVLTPASPIAPFDPYGMSKVLGERWFGMRNRASSGKTTTVLRLTGVYGPLDRGMSAVSKLVASARAGLIKLSGTGSVKRDFCFGPDLARLLSECVSRRASGVYNVASGASLSIHETATIVCRCINPAARMEFEPAASGNRDYDLVFDQTGFYAAFPGFQFTAQEEAIKSYL